MRSLQSQPTVLYRVPQVPQPTKNSHTHRTLLDIYMALSSPPSALQTLSSPPLKVPQLVFAFFFFRTPRLSARNLVKLFPSVLSDVISTQILVILISCFRLTFLSQQSINRP